MGLRPSIENITVRAIMTNTNKRAVVLLSGGLDSVVSLARADNEMEIRLVLFVNYGQRALERERVAVVAVANYYGLPFREVDLGWLGALGPKGMRGDATPDEIPPGDLNSLDAVWIPNRNGLFLNVAAAFAEAYECQYVVTGFNRDEAVAFPDNRPEYVMHVNKGLELSTRNRVQAVSFTQDLGKPEIIALGVELCAPLSVIWSCYDGGDMMCGRCASCTHLKHALDTLPSGQRPVIRFDG